MSAATPVAPAAQKRSILGQVRNPVEPAWSVAAFDPDFVAHGEHEPLHPYKPLSASLSGGGSNATAGASWQARKSLRTPTALYRTSATNFEIDWNDNYPRINNGVPTSYQINFGAPDIYGVKWKTAPHGVHRKLRRTWARLESFLGGLRWKQ